jgi:hypothetical protein
MRPAGQLQIRGNVGYDLAYISMTSTSTGRKISFVTNRRISFFEAFLDTQSQAYDLTAVLCEINDQNPKKIRGYFPPPPSWSSIRG